MLNIDKGTRLYGTLPAGTEEAGKRGAHDVFMGRKASIRERQQTVVDGRCVKEKIHQS